MTYENARRLELVPVATLRKNAENCRMHPTDQVHRLAGVIESFGFACPILVDADFKILAGHARLAALELLGRETVPVVIIDWMTPEQAQAFALADNQIGQLATWDFEALAQQLAELERLGFESEALGFGLEDLENAAATLQGDQDEMLDDLENEMAEDGQDESETLQETEQPEAVPFLKVTGTEEDLHQAQALLAAGALDSVAVEWGQE